MNKCVRDAPNNDKSFANGQTGTSANNYFGNTTQLKKSKELEDSHPPQPGGGGGYGGDGGHSC